MASPQDTEITLGTGKLLFLFFSLVGVCALFFGLGYSLGRKSEPALTTTTAAVSPVPQPSTNASKASGNAAAAQPMTFYKAVEQKNATPELTPAAETKTDSTTQSGPAASNAAQPANNTPATPPDPTTTLPSPGYFVQVAAVSKQEDADALVDALKKKQYPAFVAAPSPDKLFRVQLGPFSDVKDAEGMRTKLVGDGYSPILKR
jgi:cell division septation protein DedD